MQVTSQSLLDAMDGIVMILDQQLHITQVGIRNWQQFLDDNPQEGTVGRDCSEQVVLNRPITDFIAGDGVRTTFAKLFNSVLSGTRPVIKIDYRCDSPTLRRDMRLSVRPITTKGGVKHLLYQSIVLSALNRPGIPLFGVPVADQGEEGLLTLCTICALVAWPIGAPASAREWIEPVEYYRRGGADIALISHGFCEDCFSRLYEED